MKRRENAGIIEPPNLKRQGVGAAFTAGAVTIDKAHLAGLFNIPETRVYLPAQKHTSTVHILHPDLHQVTADAVISAEKKVLIGVQVADCVPILMYDRKRRIIGAVHAGWRGTSLSITTKTVKTMKERYNTEAGDLLIAVGPSIRSCCYETGKDVSDSLSVTVKTGKYCHIRNKKYYPDLSSINIHQALSLGVREENVWQSNECTFCSHGRFYSYRRDGKTPGRQGGFIMMW